MATALNGFQPNSPSETILYAGPVGVGGGLGGLAAWVDTANVSVPQARASPSQRVEFCLSFIIFPFLSLVMPFLCKPFWPKGWALAAHPTASPRAASPQTTHEPF